MVSKELRAGECVALPTETVYGLAANALDEQAARKIFDIKGRPLIDPLIVHVLDRTNAEKIAVVSAKAQLLMENFWPGPLTLVLPRLPKVPDLITSGLDTVAVRAPAHTLFRQVLEKSQLCLAAPSANPFGYISPTRAEHVSENLGTSLGYVLDGGPCQHGVESTIVDLSDDDVKILRPGPIQAKALETILGTEVKVALQHMPNKGKALKAAGTLARHYSPKTSCYLVKKFSRTGDDGARVWCQRPNSDQLESSEFNGHQYWLSESGSPEEMMSHLYDLLHRLDQSGAEWIEFEDPGDSPQLLTLKDRLKRACFQG